MLFPYVGRKTPTQHRRIQRNINLDGLAFSSKYSHSQSQYTAKMLNFCWIWECVVYANACLSPMYTYVCMCVLCTLENAENAVRSLISKLPIYCTRSEFVLLLLYCWKYALLLRHFDADISIRHSYILYFILLLF